jgi:hypothetical protein
MKILKKFENALLEKNVKVIISTFFFLSCHKNPPILGFYSKRADHCFFIIRSKNVFCINNYLGILNFIIKKF